MTAESISIDRNHDEEELDIERRGGKNRDTFHSSMDGTLVPTSPKSTKLPEETMYPVPALPYFEHKSFVPSSMTYDPNNYSSSITDVCLSDDEDKTKTGQYLRCFDANTTTKTFTPQNKNENKLDHK